VATATNFTADEDRSAVDELSKRRPSARWLSFQLDSNRNPHNGGKAMGFVAGLLLFLGVCLSLAGLRSSAIR
jgi:hypothetical protein